MRVYRSKFDILCVMRYFAYVITAVNYTRVDITKAHALWLILPFMRGSERVQLSAYVV